MDCFWKGLYINQILYVARQQRSQYGNNVVNLGQSACFQERVQKTRTLPYHKIPYYFSETLPSELKKRTLIKLSPC